MARHPTRASASAESAASKIPQLNGEAVLALGDSHLARLADEQHTLPGARLTRAPRLRRRARRVWSWGVWAREAVVRPWRYVWNPQRPLGRLWAHLRLVRPTETLNLWKALLLLLAAVIGLLAFVRFHHHSELTGWLWEPRKVKGEELPWWQRRAGAAVTGALFTAAVVGLLASLWNDLFRCPWLGLRIRWHIRKNPACVLHRHLGERRAKLVPVRDPLELAPRSSLFEEILPGVLAREKGVQIIAGEPGAGKTTALVELGALLARIGVMPVLVPLRAKQKVEDLVKLAHTQFVEQTEPFVRSDAEGELLWRWLTRRRRVAVLVDDIDQIGPDGERGYVLRRSIEEAASSELAILATLRPAGVPAGIAASSIELGWLEESTAADSVVKGAREDPAFSSESVISRRWIEDWIREGALAEVPFYLELLAHLVAGGRCPKLPAPDPHALDGKHGGRYRPTADGGYVWNPLWVRFLLLERFYEEAAAGRVRRWLGIRAQESRGSLIALEGAALGMLAAVGIRARGDANGSKSSGATGTDAGDRPHLREAIEDFIDTRDREPRQRHEDEEDGQRDPCLQDEQQRPGVSVHEVIDTGERLRILDCAPTGELQFRHRIMQAYLAGCRLALILKTRIAADSTQAARAEGVDEEKAHNWLKDLLDPSHPEKLTAHMALTFAALGAKIESEAADSEAAASREADTVESRKQEADAWRKVAEQITERLLAGAQRSLPADDGIDGDSVTALVAIASDPTGRSLLSMALVERESAGETLGSDREISSSIDPTSAPTPRRTDPDDALAKLTAAAEIACAIGCPESVARGGTGKFKQDLVKAVKKAHFATRWTKLEAIKAIAQLESSESWRCVWQFARDQDYLVRKEASAALERNAFDAFKKLRSDIESTILRASARSALGLPLMRAQHPDGRRDRDGQIREAHMSGGNGDLRIDDWGEDDVWKLKALAWILPAIVSGLREDPATHAQESWRGRDGGQPLHGERPSRSLRLRRGRAEIDYRHFPDYVMGAHNALEQLVALAFQGDHHSLEEALALGFKGDAMRHAHGEEELGRLRPQAQSELATSPTSTAGPGWVANNRRLVLEVCIERAGSWYARLLLYQALALYTIAGAAREEALDTFAAHLHRSRERHPFTQKAARLARAAVYRASMGTPRWHAFIWDDEGPIAGRVQALLDRPAAQLCADVTVLLDLKEGSPDDRRRPFGAMHQLPHCLSASADRAEILGKGCPGSCGWGFCPYKQPPPDEPNAHRGVTRAFCREQQRYAHHHRPRWQRHISHRRLREFWREMERRART